MPNIITNKLRIINSDAFAERISSQPTYIYIGKSTAWPDDQVPPNPIDCDLERSNLFKNILALKRIPEESKGSVVPRVDWTSGVVYDSFNDQIDMIDDRKQNGDKYSFYVLNDEFNVYKCLSNNSGAYSISKPTSQQLTPFQTPDGYVWKYMYTIRSVDVFNYMTQDWIPIYTIDANDGSTQWQVQESAIEGAIYDVTINNGGLSYNPSNVPVVTITGDGTGFTAIVELNLNNGAVNRVIVTNPGSGYTTATISLSNVGAGSGAMFTPIMSPVGGHGKDARLELGGVHKMIKVNLGGTEGGTFPIGEFRQAGIIYKPLDTELGTKLTLLTTNGYEIGDTVTGGTTGATGRIRLIDSNKKVLWLDTVVNVFIQSETITSQTGQSAAVQHVESSTNIVLVKPVASNTQFKANSGELLYISNREKIVRSATQTEEIRLIISF